MRITLLLLGICVALAGRVAAMSDCMDSDKAKSTEGGESYQSVEDCRFRCYCAAKADGAMYEVQAGYAIFR
ncbi:hypothetical protein CLAFUW4_20018 [Fulvia fulva]|uniref:uncharacterized protein n=1 Tax=Passalora fulva TaxID=5499 RepID=UPI002852742A|nr:uncharacterized protein CLAFUR5_20018 [Fulvia fulva]KAK4631629.1 hypothetical protein CLAFUR4_20018 [Fulvia fulva]KAK4633780.1 hypothetical protein CLAFUR0_20018 [Fulvia fulva]WMI38807.1 hypothetical protein CLAFUR5_20018 [Fulvia fulva]WPV11477.1 hypothetical protein CLAFUW4_20018 [Fulvia fulva]WPV25961.1 hypothetical protein CLAFUW7_20018 [Fulvia fulva]